MRNLESPQLGDLIRRFRLTAGLSQEELAARAGLSTRGISDLERGLRTSPHLETLRLLASALGLSENERSAMLAAARPELQQPPRPRATTAKGQPASARRAKVQRSLPAPPTRLIGRDAAAREISALLTEAGARLVTLTGPGGVGKTRLAIEVAHNLASAYLHGAVFVDLSVLSSGAHVIPAVLDAVGHSGNPGPDPSEHLIGVLSQQSLLLVMDNYEHLLDKATVVSTLLTKCPDVSILVTSRVRLSIRGEHVYTVLPLELPLSTADSANAEAIRLSDVPAVRLLLERADQSGPGFTLNDQNRDAIVSICRRLDGLPLAIELATTWLRVLSPDDLLDRLTQRLPALGGGARDAPARHQTLRDTLGWSLEHLTPPDQQLFRRLAVFSGGATLDAIRIVAGNDGQGDVELLDVLSSLVDNSLVRRQDDAAGESRFLMLETIREFARELLDQSDEAGAIRSAHAAWIQDLAERAEPELVGPQETHWRRLLTAEQANVRGALDWAIIQGDVERALRISGAMWRYWSKRDLLEARDWLTRSLDLPGQPEPETRARALQALANILHDLGDFPAARTRFEASLAIRRTLPNQSLIANSLNGLGIVAFAEGEFDHARRLHQESLALSRESGHLVGIGNALSNLATVEKALGAFDRSRTLQEEALEIRRTLGDENFIGYSLYNLGTLARAEYRLTDARTLFQEALRLFRAAGDQFGVAFALTDLGAVSQQLGDPGAGANAMREAIAIRQEMGDRRGLIDCLEAAAEIAGDLGQDQTSATILGAASHQRDDLHTPRTPSEQVELDRWSKLLEDRLGSAGYDEALATGRDLSTQASIALAEVVLMTMAREDDTHAK